MPHAVLLGATNLPAIPVVRDDGRLHRVVETFEGPHGWLLKSLIVRNGDARRLLVRVDRRGDGLLVRLDDHLMVERTGDVFRHLAIVAEAVLRANPGARVGPTNLALIA